MRVVQCLIIFTTSIGFGWSFVWLAFTQPQAMPYVVMLIATCLLGQYWLEVRSERKRSASQPLPTAGHDEGHA